MKIQYFTFRPINFAGKIMGPNYSFNHELNTIEGLKYTFVCDKTNDNRKLGYFEYNNDFELDIVSETLMKYSYHVKSIEGSKSFIEESFGSRIEKLEVIGDSIEFNIKHDGIILDIVECKKETKKKTKKKTK